MIAHLIGPDTGAAIVAISWLGAAFCLGGLSGLWLAWSQPARVDHWAKRVERMQRIINELEDRADGVPTDRELFGTRDLALLQASASRETGRASGVNSGVQPVPSVAVVDPGQGPQAVIA